MLSNKLYYPNGALYAAIGDETRTYYYENGTLKTYEPYSQGRIHGEVLLYWPNGQMKRRSHFVRGIREGMDEMWSEGGQIVDEGSYELGRAVGVHRRWTSKGDQIEEISYIDSIRFNYRRWDELGQLSCEAIWTDESYLEKTWDRFQGIWTEKQGRWNGKKLVYV